MKSRTNTLLQLVAFLSAVFMLLVSTGASISIHYCNGNVIDFAVNKRAKVCEGYYELEIDNSVGCSISRKGCCEDDDRLLLVENDYPPTHNTSFQKTPIVSLLSIEEHDDILNKFCFPYLFNIFTFFSYVLLFLYIIIRLPWDIYMSKCRWFM